RSMSARSSTLTGASADCSGAAVRVAVTTIGRSRASSAATATFSAPRPSAAAIARGSTRGAAALAKQVFRKYFFIAVLGPVSDRTENERVGTMKGAATDDALRIFVMDRLLSSRLRRYARACTACSDTRRPHRGRLASDALQAGVGLLSK